MNHFDTFTKIAKECGDLGKLLVAKGYKKLPKVQKIAQSGHTIGCRLPTLDGYVAVCLVLTIDIYASNFSVQIIEGIYIDLHS